MRSRLQKYLAESALDWYLKNQLKSRPEIKILIVEREGCWGTCEQIGSRYKITISPHQSVRDFIATVMHELIHVKQWETGIWQGTGERECKKLEYKFADQAWSEGVF
jgi:hypothetical protein